MKVLMLSTDKKIFEETSAVRQRMVEYGRLVDELYIFIPTWNDEFKVVKLSENVTARPVYIKNRYHALFVGPKKIAQFVKKHFGKDLRDFLITSQDPFDVGFFAWLVARKLKAPFQLQVHTDYLNSYFQGQSFKNWWTTKVSGYLYKKAKRIRVVSNKISQSIQEKFNIPAGEIDVLPIFVNVERFANSDITGDLHEKYPQFEKIILVASRLAEEKNIALALKAVSKIPDVGLIIVGEGPERDNLQLKSKDLRISDRVVFENWQDDLASYYKTSDVFLLTSNYEGYGMTLVEAAACGATIVSTDVGIAPEVTDYVCPVGGVDCLTQKLNQALEEKKKSRLPEGIITSKEEYLEKYKQSWYSCVS